MENNWYGQYKLPDSTSSQAVLGKCRTSLSDVKRAKQCLRKKDRGQDYHRDALVRVDKKFIILFVLPRCCYRA